MGIEKLLIFRQLERANILVFLDFILFIGICSNYEISQQCMTWKAVIQPLLALRRIPLPSILVHHLPMKIGMPVTTCCKFPPG